MDDEDNNKNKQHPVDCTNFAYILNTNTTNNLQQVGIKLRCIDKQANYSEQQNKPKEIDNTSQ